MKKIVVMLLVFIAVFYTASSAVAANRIASVSGNWTATNTWGGDPVPVAGDTATINAGVVVTVDVTNAECERLLIGTTAGTATLTFAATGNPKLTTSGGVTVGSTNNVGGLGAILFSNGSTLICGTNLTHGAMSAQSSTIDMTAGGLLSVHGSIVRGVGALWAPGIGTVELTANNALLYTSFNHLTINGGTTTIGTNTTINGDLNIASGTLSLGAFDFTVIGNSVISGTLDCENITGTKVFTGNVTIGNGGIWSSFVDEDFSFGGSFQNNGSMTMGSGTYHFTGVNRTFSGIEPVEIANLNISGNYTNLGTLTVSATLAGTGSLIQATNAILNMAGTSEIASLWATAHLNAVNYTGAAQTVKPIAYHNLGLSGSGGKSLTDVSTINGNLTTAGSVMVTNEMNLVIGGDLIIGAGTEVRMAGFDFTVIGNTYINGLLGTTRSLDGIKTFAGDFNLNNSGYWDIPVDESFTFGGNWKKDGSNTTGWGMWTFTGIGKTFSGTAICAIPHATITGSYTNLGRMFVEGFFLGTGKLTQAENAILDIGDSNVGIAELVADTNPNTIIYGSTNSQTARAMTYDQLIFSSGYTVTLGGPIMVKSNLTVMGNTTMDVSSNNYAISVGGNWANSNGVFVARSGTVTFNGSGSQSIVGPTLTAFNHVALSGTSTVMLSADLSIGGKLSISGATVGIANGVNLGVNSLTLGGANKIAGTWGSTSSSAVHQDNTYFNATTGFLTVSNGPATTTALALTAGSNPSVYGAALIFTATVTGTNGTTAPTGTVTFKDGVVTLGAGTLSGSTATFNGAGLTAGAHADITAVYEGDSNFAGSMSGSLAQTVNVATLTVSGITANNKAYDGTNTAILNTGSAALVGVLNGDAITLDTTGATGTFADGNIGAGKPVSVSGLTISGAKAVNYSLTQPTTVADISAATLIFASDDANRVYGAANPALTGSISGLLNGDNISATYSSSADTNSPVGSYLISQTISDPDGKLLNYAAATNNGSLSVSPATLSVSADDVVRFAGSPNPDFTVKYIGFVNGETLMASDLTGAPSLTTDAVTDSPAGTYVITNAVGTLASTNYSISFSNGILTVQPLVLSSMLTAGEGNFYGTPAATYTIQYLDNFSTTNWLVLAQVTTDSETGLGTFVDPTDPSTRTERYYRISIP